MTTFNGGCPPTGGFPDHVNGLAGPNECDRVRDPPALSLQDQRGSYPRRSGRRRRRTSLTVHQTM